MTAYDSRPWTALYPTDVPAELPAPDRTLLEHFEHHVQLGGDRPLFYYFERVITFREVAEWSWALAERFAEAGIGRGDRIAAYVQNDPEFAIAQLASWKLGAVFVSINPMLKEQELEHILVDSGAVALVALHSLYDEVAKSVLPTTTVRLVVTADPDAWLSPVAASSPVDTPLTYQVVALRALSPHPLPVRVGGSTPSLDDVACIGYTSGTSGRPKGVRTTHGNLAYNAEVYRRWLGIGSDVFMCGTPLFHVTGLVAGLALSYLGGTPMVLFHRFKTSTFLELCQRWGGTFSIMSITAYQAILADPEFDAERLQTLTKVYSGGAAVGPSAGEAWRSRTGQAIHNVYGLTETTSPSHAVPLGVEAPVDRESGALSVGVPVPGAEVRIVDATTQRDAPVGDLGEIWVRGPMVAAGYWNQPEATAASFVDGYLRTGDIGKMNAEGWFFVIDRLKDMINASGYKVWPREVEDYLGQHPAVLESSVVGVPDPYRGETVVAFVALRPGACAQPEELVAYCRESMAAYKYPRRVHILDELPKTASGKILRRELRALAVSEPGDD